MKNNQRLSASSLYEIVRTGFGAIKDQRTKKVEISLQDILMSGFALFSLKDPSLLAFDARREAPENLHTVYGIEQIACDTHLRTVLDEVNPEQLRPVYKRLFERVEQEKVLESYRFMGQYYIVSPDGTGYFASPQINCPHCLEKRLRNGETHYYHYLLGAAIVHPRQKTVIPLMPEPIMRQDGATKNDSERNAAKRFLHDLRQDHPTLPLLIVEDSLSSNAPHIQELQKHKLRFILGAKPGDHKFLFQSVAQAHAAGRSTDFEVREAGVTHRFQFVNQVPLNESHPDLLVNFLEYWERTDSGEQYFSWVTDIAITQHNAYALMRGGRARWKTENETFNTLKNQGYHFEHNFGHGQQHLSVIFANLMMLAFLVDQLQEAASLLFQAALAKVGSKIRLWEKMRAYFLSLAFDTMEMLYKAIVYGYRIEKIVIFDDTA
jgi:hypothetical protein